MDIEQLYWQFDAAHCGIGEYAGMARSERDAFKLVVGHALAEKDREIARWKNTIRDEYVGFLAESKENLLQQYVNLTQMYGEQKHEIRRLLATIAEKDREIQQIREHEYQSGYRDGEAFREKAHHALMGKAIEFAQYLDTAFWPGNNAVEKAQEFLTSPEVQAWREQEGGHEK